MKLIASIWERLMSAPFDAEKLAETLIHDGGHDIEPLTKSDLIGLMENSYAGDWKYVTFSFSEMLAYYSCCDLNNIQVIAWCFSVLTIGEASRRSATDWKSHFYLLTQGFKRVTGTLKYEEFASILSEALQ